MPTNSLSVEAVLIPDPGAGDPGSTKPVEDSRDHPAVTRVGHSCALKGYTVAEVARRYRVGEDKIRAWIRRGEMAAINTSATMCGKPRWVITPEALAEFEQRRAGGPTPNPPRRKKRSQQVDYYP